MDRNAIVGYIIGITVIILIITFGPYLTGGGGGFKVNESFAQFMNNSNEKCSDCLSQFHDFNCTPSNTSRVCNAIKYEYCLSNCTIELQNGK